MARRHPIGQGPSARRGGSPYPKVEFWPRLLAKTADGVIAGLFAYVVPVVGPILALLYLLLADGFGGQSAGKRLLGVRAVHVPSRRPSNVRQSVVRNLPITLAAALLMNPFLAIVALPILAFELYMAWTDGLGVRIGDVFADTQVVDTKIPLSAAEGDVRPLPERRPPLPAEVGEPAGAGVSTRT